MQKANCKDGLKKDTQSAGQPGTCEVPSRCNKMQYWTAHTEHKMHKYTHNNAMVLV